MRNPPRWLMRLTGANPIVPTTPITSMPFPFNGRPQNSATSGAVYIEAVFEASPALELGEERLSVVWDRRRQRAPIGLFPGVRPFALFAPSIPSSGHTHNLDGWKTEASVSKKTQEIQDLAVVTMTPEVTPGSMKMGKFVVPPLGGRPRIKTPPEGGTTNLFSW